MSNIASVAHWSLVNSIWEPLERRTLMSAIPISDFSAPDSGLIGTDLTIGDTRYYAFNDGVRGYELWKANPSNPGGVLVKDINATPLDAAGRTSSSTPNSFFQYGDLALFIADNGTHGRELWRTDGTAAGTYMLLDLNKDDPYPPSPYYVPFNGKLIIGGSWQSLYYTDGTAAGTRSLNVQGGSNFFTANGKLYFSSGGYIARYVYEFDGTHLKTLFHKGQSNLQLGYLRIRADGALTYQWSLYFQGPSRPGSSGDEVIATTGAAAVPYTTVSRNVPDRAATYYNLGTFNGLAFFNVNGALVATDGSAGGLRELLADANVVGNIEVLNDRAFFVRSNNDGFHELWTTDGTIAGTQFVFTIDQQTRLGAYVSTKFNVINDRLVFGSHAADGSWELHSTDGTDNQFLVTLDSANPLFEVHDGSLFIRTATGGKPGVLRGYKSDGTTAGTTLVYRRSGSAPGVPLNVGWFINVIDGKFVLAPPESGYSDEILDEANVLRITDRNFTDEIYTSVAGNLVFAVGSRRDSLRVIDAINGGESVQLLPTGGLFSIDSRAVLGNLLYFTVGGTSVGTPAMDVWRSDGTIEGTFKLVHLKSFNTTSIDASAQLNGFQYFIGDDGKGGQALWKTDGTVDGTTIVRTFSSRLEGSLYKSTVIDGVLYFTIDDGLHGNQIWRTDGTSAGTWFLRADDATGSRITTHPMRAANALVAGGFTLGSGSEIFALDETAPPHASIQLRSGTLSVIGTEFADAVEIRRTGLAGEALEIIVNGDVETHLIDDLLRLRIFAMGGNDRVILSESNGAIVIPASLVGGDGNDILQSASGADTLYGGDGDDALYGGASRDWLFGDAGKDRINGGGGLDILWGGAGRDTFLSSLASERRDHSLIDDVLA